MSKEDKILKAHAAYIAVKNATWAALVYANVEAAAALKAFEQIKEVNND